MMSPLTQNHYPALLRAVTLALGLAVGSVGAQTTPGKDFLVYKTQPGDTLLGLVNKHLQGPDALKLLIQSNRLANVNRIAVGQKVNIPRHLLKHTPSTATVTLLNCKTIIQIEGNASYAVKIGSVLGEGAVLRIPAGCQFALTLEDESTLRLMSGAVLQIKTLRRNSLEASPEVNVELLDGRMEIDVPRKRLGNDAPFQVLTPTSVAGVRGTEFRVGFDAKHRSSQIEVKAGAVGARGGLETSEKRTETGYGLSVMPNGQSLDVEKLLTPPRYASGEVQRGGKDWLLKFESPSQAERFFLVIGDDANFASVLSESRPTVAQVLAPDLSSKSVFYRWASISPSGLMGQSVDYAVCKGYRRLDQWRCNVPMNMTGLVKPKLVFQKVEEKGQVIELLNGQVESAGNNLLVFRGLPAGMYRWRIQHEVSDIMKASIDGEFELVTIPGAE